MSAFKLSRELLDEVDPKYRSLAEKFEVVPMGATKGIRKCDFCQDEYLVKFADLKRGWGRCCSKSCSALKNDKGSNRRKGGTVVDFDGSWDSHDV